MDNKAVLITGGFGFIGSHLAQALAPRNRVLRMGWRSFPKTNDTQTHGKSVNLDIRSPRVAELVKSHQPNVVFHLAAQSYPNKSWCEPKETFEINVLGTHNLLDAVRQHASNAVVVLASSSAIYGAAMNNHFPLREDTVHLPLHPYGVSKLAMESLATMFSLVHSLHCVSARIFNTIGPGKRGDVVGDLCERLVSTERSDVVDNTLRVGNMDTRRAFLDVRDTVRALIALAELGDSGWSYNISHTQVHAVRDVLTYLLRHREGGGVVRIERDESLLRPSDEPIIWGDITRIGEKTGWHPEISLSQTLDDTLVWWRAEGTSRAS